MEENENHKQRRSTEITKQYLGFLDGHIDDVVHGRVQAFMQLSQIARELAVSHQHLTDVVQKEMGNHPCHFYDAKIIEQAKLLLAKSDMSIAGIALTLTYDASNFSKFFKKWTGETPGAFRKKSNG